MKNLILKSGILLMLFVTSFFNQLNAQTDCSNSSNCTCDLTVEITNLSEDPAFSLIFGSATYGFCQTITAPGIYHFTVDASDISYYLALTGDITRVNLGVDISGCDIEESIVLNRRNDSHFVLIEDQCTVDCSPSEECPCDLSLNVLNLSGAPFELLFGTVNGWCETITESGIYNFNINGQAAQYIMTLQGSLNNVSLSVNISGCEIDDNVLINSQNSSHVLYTEVCQNTPPCPLPTGTAELVFAGCNGANTLFDVIFPNYPVVDVNDITIETPCCNAYSNTYFYYDAQNRLHFNGVRTSGITDLCFKIVLGEDCSEEYCFPLPDCITKEATGCGNTSLTYILSSCYSDEEQLELVFSPVFYDGSSGVASDISAYNIENPGEADFNTFSAAPNQYTSISLAGTDVNGDGLVTFHIQIFAADGTLLCDDYKTLNPEFICDDDDLLEYIFMGGTPPGSNDEGRDENRFSNLNINNQSIKQSTVNDLNVYPIPASNVINIENPEQLNLSVEVLNVDGKLISKSAFSQDYLLSIQSESFSAGIYLLRVKDQQNNVVLNKLVPVTNR